MYFSLPGTGLIIHWLLLLAPRHNIGFNGSGVGNSSYLETFFQDDIGRLKNSHLNCRSIRLSINFVKLAEIRIILRDGNISDRAVTFLGMCFVKVIAHRNWRRRDCCPGG